MDLALAMSLLKQADRCGAEDAVIWVRKSRVRTEKVDSKQIAHELNDEMSCRMIVRAGTGTAAADLVQGKAGLPGDAALLESVRRLCQGARLCGVWGTSGDRLADVRQAFDRHALYALSFSGDCSASGEGCSSMCFDAHCLELDDPMYAGLLHGLARRTQPFAREVDWHGSLRLALHEETLYSLADTRTVFRFEAWLDQALKVRSAQGRQEISLPRYRFSEPVFEISAHPAMPDAGDLARGIWGSAVSEEVFGFDSKGLVLSGWAMAVLGREAHHLNVDITRSGRLIYDISRCMNTPDGGGRCRNLAMGIALERTLTREVMLSRVPDRALYVDAPECWIRRNEKILDVRFLVAGEIIGGQVAAWYAPVVLRFDLTKLWYYCLLAAKPYVQISLRCGEAETVAQAPCGYFDVEPCQGEL